MLRCLADFYLRATEMPPIKPIPAITYSTSSGGDLSSKIAPPYDVLDEAGKARLLSIDPRNIVAIDLPHLPAKTVGPDATYEKAAELYRTWLSNGTLIRQKTPVLFVYQQTYSHGGKTFRRRGLIANVKVQPFGKSPDNKGGIHPHEQTFSGPKEDRMKLMRATRAQLSPIFGLHSDPTNKVHALLTKVIESTRPTLRGTTAGDGVLHEAWSVEDPAAQKPFLDAFADSDIFIADGHHRYTTALNYRNSLAEQSGGSLAEDHPANYCFFVLVAMQDPGLIVLPTHRVLGGMSGFTWEKFIAAAKGKLNIKPFAGDGLTKLEAALPSAGPHAIGLFCPSHPSSPLAIATTVEQDPLRLSHSKQSEAWRQLDVAIVQHLIVEGICQPSLCSPGGGETVQWKFPHTLEEFQRDTTSTGFQLGLLVQPTPLESVRLVSQAGELMPQKSTFFYPKLVTGFVINPLE